jgi:hypothetical protein
VKENLEKAKAAEAENQYWKHFNERRASLAKADKVKRIAEGKARTAAAEKQRREKRIADAHHNNERHDKQQKERVKYMAQLKPDLDVLSNICKKNDSYEELLTHIYKAHPPRGKFAGKNMGSPPPHTKKGWKKVLIRAIQRYHANNNPFEGNDDTKEWAVLAEEITKLLTIQKDLHF